jgi:hypothetical protein
LDTEALAVRLSDPNLRIFDCTMHLAPLSDNSGQQGRTPAVEHNDHLSTSHIQSLQEWANDPSVPMEVG